MAAKSQKARDVMSRGVRCVGEKESLRDAARMMRDLNVGALPICGDDDRLQGMITDRDIVVRCCADGVDVSRVKAGEFKGELYWVDAEADINDALKIMRDKQVRRLPVIDTKNDKKLVGMISEADLARCGLPDQKMTDFTKDVYAR